MVLGSSAGVYDPTTTTTTSPVTGSAATLVVNGLNDVYGYDSFGNMTRYNGFTPNYGANNRMVGWPYDAAGNMLTNGLAQMVWDTESRISAVTGASYLYDAQGNRVESSGSSVTDTVYFNGRRMARLVNGQWTDLIYGPTGLLAEVAGQENAEPQYRLLDHLGTQVGTTDSVQLLKNPLDYNPFGQIRSGNTADPYFFTGKERDAESGLDYFGARYYASSMGRWMSPDWADKPEAVPYSDLSDPQSLNLYGYVRNNPLSKADADGHECCDQVSDFFAGIGKGGSQSIAPNRINAPSSNDSAASLAGQLVGSGIVGALGADLTLKGGGAIGAGILGAPESGTASLGVSAAGVVAVGVGVTAVKDAVDNAGAVAQAMVKAGGNFSSGTRQGAKDAAEGKCQNCGVETTPGQKSQKGVSPPKTEGQTDHIVPRSKGGTNDPSNTQHLCRDCNIKKSNKLTN